MAQPTQADILAALQAQASGSKRKLPETTAFTAHLDPAVSLTTSTSTSGAPKNSTRIYCHRQGCGSLIILDGVAEWVTAEPDLIPIEEGSPFKSAPLPSSEAAAPKGGYWHIKGGPMSFENVGYSRPSASVGLPPGAPGTESGKPVKWLICAECDLGPVGWSFEGGQESWLSADRVRYGPKS